MPAARTAPPLDDTYDVTLSWREWVTLRRLRLGWTKRDLARECGVSRVTLWETLETQDPDRLVDPSPRIREKIEDALNRAERGA